MPMRRTLIAAALATTALGGAAPAQDGPTVGVSWSNFQEERWKTDEAAIKAALEEAGAEYVSVDAQSSSKQLSDVESLIAQGVDALVIVAQDAQAIGPAVDTAADEGIPVSGQDADHAALNRVAKGTQTVSVFKDSRDLGSRAGEIAVELADGAEMSEIEGAEPYTTPGGTEVMAEFLEPVPITQDSLDVVVDAGWIDRATLCQGVSGENAPEVCRE